MCCLFTFSLVPNHFSKSSKVSSFFKDVSLHRRLEPHFLLIAVIANMLMLKLGEC